MAIKIKQINDGGQVICTLKLNKGYRLTYVNMKQFP